MPAALVVLLRTLGLLCRGHRAVALENGLLRQQLAVLRRTVRRPHLPSPPARSAVLGPARHSVAGLANGLDRRAARHGRALASQMAPAPLDTTLNPNTSGPPEHHGGHSDPRRPDDRGGSSLGMSSHHGELRKLGITVSERAVSRLLRRCRRPPSQTWCTFLTNHVASLVSMDFFIVPTLTGRVLFVLVLLTHHRRRIVHLAITEHPTAGWTAQQIIEAFPNATCAALAVAGTRADLRCGGGHGGSFTSGCGAADSRSTRASWLGRSWRGRAVSGLVHVNRVIGTLRGRRRR